MDKVQLLSIELGAECNLAAAHPKCPSASRRLSGRPLTDEKILSLAVEAYAAHGFRGLVGWHYYNEPTLQLDRMLGLMQRIRAAVPESRFILWSNGTQPCADPRMALFDKAQISNYLGDEALLRARFAAVRDLTVFTPRFDDRLAAPVGAEAGRPCLRPFVEIPVDNSGAVHLCCQDWEGEIALGNVWSDDWTEILRRREAVIGRISRGAMTPDAPERCRRCSGRVLSLPDFEPVARGAAMEWLAPAAGGRR